MNNIDLCKSCFKSLVCEMPHMRFNCTEFESSLVNTSKVDHPSYYNQSGVETIESIKSITGEGFEGYLLGNTVKYIGRYKYKNGVEDLRKAVWHLEKLIKEIEEKEIQK